ncbi:MAG TPA: tyrosine--tRNA ligase [Chloroflexota bacterium]
MLDAIDLLRERGFVQDVSDEMGLREAFASGPVTFYWGTDPTASSLTAGHLVSLMLLAHLQRAGHRPIVVVGGGTGLIGDPTGKTEMRQMLSEADIEVNLAGQRSQVARYLDFNEGKALMLNNADWLRPLGYLEFLRDVGRHFSVNQLLQHSTYRERLDTGLNFIELNYALLQAYDFLHLFREHGCSLQVGGNDQWFNILAGVDLIRRVASGEAYALVTPLLTTSTGEKMGKTAGNAVWLDPLRTSPYDFYQYWINIPDLDVERFLGFFTFLPMDDVRRLGGLEGAESRTAKEVLAYEATRITHGDKAAVEARDASRALFGAGGDVEGAPTTTTPKSRLQGGLDLADLLVETGLAQSKRAARDLIRQGGAYVNGRRAEPGAEMRLDDLEDGALLLRAGKKHYHRVIVEG